MAYSIDAHMRHSLNETGPSLVLAWTRGWINRRVAGDLKRYGAHCNVIVMNPPPRPTCLITTVKNTKTISTIGLDFIADLKLISNFQTAWFQP